MFIHVHYAVLICWKALFTLFLVGTPDAAGPPICLALGAPLLLPSLLDKAPRQGDIQEFAAARRLANAICWVVLGYGMWDTRGCV